MSSIDEFSEGQNRDEQTGRNLANADATAPNPENLRQGWETEKALSRVEKQLGYDEKEWGRCARICARAAHLTGRPDAAALFELGQLNGTRRVPQPDWNLVAQLLRDTGNQIGKLEESTKKKRLQELHTYHHGITARYTG